MPAAAREIASGATAIFFGGLPFFYLADRPGLDERFAEAALGAFAKDKAVLPRSRFFARRPKMNAGIAVLALSSKPPDALVSSVRHGLRVVRMAHPGNGRDAVHLDSARPARRADKADRSRALRPRSPG
jgi:hypothetical protein